jgi:hypothetical protein
VLTLKLKGKGGRIFIVECVSVDIQPEGNRTKVDAYTVERPSIPDTYVVADEGGDAVMAYVENSAGATTQVVKPGK